MSINSSLNSSNVTRQYQVNFKCNKCSTEWTALNKVFNLTISDFCLLLVSTKKVNIWKLVPILPANVNMYLNGLK